MVGSNLEGIVEEVGLRSTKLRTFYHSLIIIPNHMLTNTPIDNYGKRQFRRYVSNLDITYGTPPQKVEAFCCGIRKLIKEHPFTRKDRYHVYLNDFGPHSLRIILYVFWELNDYDMELRERHRLLLDILRLAKELEIEFAFPTQTLFTQSLDSEAQAKFNQNPPHNFKEWAEEAATIISSKSIIN